MSPQQPSFQLQNCPLQPPTIHFNHPLSLPFHPKPLSLTLSVQVVLLVPITVMPERHVGLLAGGFHPWNQELPALGSAV